jgi:hypothetical protein
MSASKLSPADTFDRKLDRLCALLNVAMCDNFTTYNRKIQSDYLWACADLAEDLRSAWARKDSEVKS